MQLMKVGYIYYTFGGAGDPCLPIASQVAQPYGNSVPNARPTWQVRARSVDTACARAEFTLVFNPAWSREQGAGSMV